jgi:uncharacterized protein (TIGR02996 family)
VLEAVQGQAPEGQDLVTDRDALLNAVLADPDDDLPRLVFADWLDEHGEPDRGEFVRVQVELSKWQAEHPDCFDEPLPACSRCRRILALRSRERELFRGEWDEELGAFASTENPAPVWRRGFVASVALSAADAAAHLDAVLAAHPVIEVTLTTLPPVYSAITGDPAGDSHEVRWAVYKNFCDRWPTIRAWHLPPEPAHREFDRVQITRSGCASIPCYPHVLPQNPADLPQNLRPGDPAGRPPS